MISQLKKLFGNKSSHIPIDLKIVERDVEQWLKLLEHCYFFQ